MRFNCSQRCCLSFCDTEKNVEACSYLDGAVTSETRLGEYLTVWPNFQWLWCTNLVFGNFLPSLANLIYWGQFSSFQLGQRSGKQCSQLVTLNCKVSIEKATFNYPFNWKSELSIGGLVIVVVRRSEKGRKRMSCNWQKSFKYTSIFLSLSLSLSLWDPF